MLCHSHIKQDTYKSVLIAKPSTNLCLRNLMTSEGFHYAIQMKIPRDGWPTSVLKQSAV